jgi:hypothetical protein
VAIKYMDVGIELNAEGISPVPYSYTIYSPLGYEEVTLKVPPSILYITAPKKTMKMKLHNTNTPSAVLDICNV